MTTFPWTDVGVVPTVLRSLNPFRIGHFVFVQRGSTEGLKGIKFNVTEVVTVPSSTSPPGFTKRTVIPTSCPAIGGSGRRARSLISKRLFPALQSLIFAWEATTKEANNVLRKKESIL